MCLVHLCPCCILQCRFPVDDVVESEAMIDLMIDFPMVCSMEYFKRCGVCFLNLDASYQKQKMQVISSHVFQGNECSTSVTDLQLLNRLQAVEAED